jgi:sterol desaturase/sphingolipid hydroxylase (fatty acid hydroxylase superfamily)
VEELLKYSSRLYALDYFGLIVVVSLVECIIPRRPAGDTLRLRWASNLGIAILDTFVVRIIFPILGIGIATLAASRGWGLFNQINLPLWLELVVTIAILDLSYYAQHYVFHRVPILWRLHRTHHTDQNFDFTTGLRFHPGESIVTTAAGLVVIVVLGAAPVAVLLSQLIALSISFFEHANLKLPAAVDRVLRLFLITPDMHRIHHSEITRESMSNFGSALPVWDRLFRTYLAEPAAGHDGIRFGLPEFQGRKHLTIPWMLAQPFLPQTNDQRTNRIPAQVRDEGVTAS